jgi:hypothetical protein
MPSRDISMRSKRRQCQELTVAELNSTTALFPLMEVALSILNREILIEGAGVLPIRKTKSQPQL